MIDGGRREGHQDVLRHLDDTCTKMVPTIVVSVHI